MNKRTEGHDAVRVGMGKTIGRMAAFVAGVCALALAAGAMGDPPLQYEIEKLLPWDEEGGYFGCSVAMQDDMIVVGAKHNDDNGYGAGAVFVFRFDGSEWVPETKLLAGDGKPYDFLGCSVATTGEVIVVGADQSGNDLDTGVAYVFRKSDSEWVQEAKLVGSDSAPKDMFGGSVAIDGETVAIGARYHDTLEENEGSVYVFRYNGSAWMEEAKLVASDGTKDAYFGWAIDLEADRLMVGAPNDDQICGAVYVFERVGRGWIETAKLTVDDVIREGRAVSLDGDRVLVSAANVHSGTALFLEYDGAEWTESSRIVEEAGFFGRSVVLSGAIAMVGAPYDDRAAEGAGAAFVCRPNSAAWTIRSILLASDAAEDDGLGSDVAYDNDLLLVGAPYCDDFGSNSGAAYLFSVPAQDCNGNGVPDDEDITNGTSEDCNENGVPDECDIADVTCWDCNQNGIPDECDIASGYSEDANGDGIADECWFPGEAGIVPLLQKRTLYVHAVDESYGYYEVEDYDEAPDFGPYDNALEVYAGYGRGAASQQSFVEQANVRASGGVEASGIGGGGFWCWGEGESDYRFTFGAPYQESLLLSGRLDADGPFDAAYAAIHLVMSDADGTVLFEERLHFDEEPVHIDVCQGIEVSERAWYTLSLESSAESMDSTCWGEFTIHLTALGDVDGDWRVDTADLLALLGAWGPNEGHPADFNGDGTVNTEDLLALLGNWGP